MISSPVFEVKKNDNADKFKTKIIYNNNREVNTVLVSDDPRSHLRRLGLHHCECVVAPVTHHQPPDVVGSRFKSNVSVLDRLWKRWVKLKMLKMLRSIDCRKPTMCDRLTATLWFKKRQPFYFSNNPIEP